MRSTAWLLRCMVLLGAGATGVHEVRYAFAYRGEPGAGHGYLAVLTPLLCVAVVTVLALALRRWARGSCGGAPLALGRLWLAATAALAVTHFGQELAESLVAAGHPGGLGPGAAGALLTCAGLGGLMALALRGAEAAGALRPAAARPGPALPAAPLHLLAPLLLLGMPTRAGRLGARAPPTAA